MEDSTEDDGLFEVLLGLPVLHWFASSHSMAESLLIPSLLIRLICKSLSSSGKDAVDMVGFCLTFARMPKCCDIMCYKKNQAYDVNRMLFQV